MPKENLPALPHRSTKHILLSYSKRKILTEHTGYELENSTLPPLAGEPTKENPSQSLFITKGKESSSLHSSKPKHPRKQELEMIKIEVWKKYFKLQNLRNQNNFMKEKRKIQLRNLQISLTIDEAAKEMLHKQNQVLHQFF